MSGLSGALIGLAAGTLAGQVHHRLLWHSLQGLGRRHAAIWQLSLYYLLRMALALALFALLARYTGWAGVLAGLAAFLLQRRWLLHRLPIEAPAGRRE